GLNCALKLREKYPKSSIAVLERGLLPKGASTKNAGFACFGSVSELLDDLNGHSEDQVLELVEKRYKGLQKLKSTLGEQQIGYKHYGGFEVFLKKAPETYLECMDSFDQINKRLYPIFKKNVFSTQKNTFSFQGVFDQYLVNSFEGQIDTGMMMDALYRKCVASGVTILYGVCVDGYHTREDDVLVKTNLGDFTTKKLSIATNGLYNELPNSDLNVRPARAQILITKPIPNLKIKGSFHLDKGFYYFRNIDNRILLGGGRNLDILNEPNRVVETTKIRQDKLEPMLREVAPRSGAANVGLRGGGIMGVGDPLQPSINHFTTRALWRVRRGGMAVASGPEVGAD